MPTTKAAAKSLRQSHERHARNLGVKNGIKSHLKKFRQAISSKSADAAKEAYRAVVKALDRAAQKKVIPKNTAARKKSRLAKTLKALGKS